jgi:ATP-binding cassette, subfamily B, multidrug efflux pump
MVQFAGHEEERDYHEMDWKLLRRIWPFVRPYKLAFLLCLLSLFVSFGLEALRPYLLRLVIDGPVQDALENQPVDESHVWTLGSIFLASTFLSVGIGYFYSWTTTLNAQRVIRDVRSFLYRHLLSVSPRYFDRNPAGKLVTRVTSDVENLNELISTGVLQSIFDLLKIVGLLSLMFVIQWQIALFTLCSIPVVLGASLLFRKFARDSFRRVRGHQARMNGFAAEAVGGVTATRVFGQQATVQSHFAELNDRTKSSWLATVFHFALFFSIVDMVIHLTQAGLLWVGGTAILDGRMTTGEFAQFWIYLSMITEPIKQLGEKYNVLQSAFASSERIFQILDEPIDPSPPADPRIVSRGKAELRCANLQFAYEDGTPVLRDISFTVPAGKTIAIVGPTGAGKSTVLSMLSRLQDPDAGSASINGVDLRELDIAELRQRIAVVPQDVYLFAGTILENVRLFDDSITEARVREALETVGAWDFVAQRPDGLHAKVEERGATFSQGEKQLLSFARALATLPDVLILDEATASIDTESELRIQSALRRLLSDRTCVVVAHRLSTVRDADEILVMRHGAIVERGTHDALLAANGLYREMHNRAATG